jgi:hypothetical protein
MAGNQLHNFGADAAERRQYPRIDLQFPLWWMKGAEAASAVAGIGVEISGGGMQFLLQESIPERACSIVFEIKARRMKANVVIILATKVMYKERPWQHNRAKFLGLLSTDFDFIMAIKPDRPVPTGGGLLKGKDSVGSLEAYEMLPAKIKEDIVKSLVGMRRLAPPREARLASLVAHYVGLQPGALGSAACYRFSIQTKMKAEVFDTHVLVSLDGTKLIICE